jgi:hypothetical protein
MTAEPNVAASGYEKQPMGQALISLAHAAVCNLPGVEAASITVRRKDQSLDTIAATDDLVARLDVIQYELREGPCYAAVTDERFVVVNNLAVSHAFPRFGPRAVELGVRSQAAIQLENDGEQAGLNLYSSHPDAFDPSTVQMAELFSVQAAALLGYVRQVGSLSQAVTTRQQIGTAVGIVMERYGLDPDHAFQFLVRLSNQSNIKLHTIAQGIIDGTRNLT